MCWASYNLLLKVSLPFHPWGLWRCDRMSNILSKWELLEYSIPEARAGLHLPAGILLQFAEWKEKTVFLHCLFLMC